MHAYNVPEVPLDFFFRSLLCTAPFGLPEALALLVKNGHVGKGCWKQFKDKSEGTEDIFQDFTQIFNAVAGVSDRIPTVEFTHAGPDDVQFRLLSSDSTIPSFGSAVPWQMKTLSKPDGSFFGNENKLISRCHAALREDARRRFSFGISTRLETMQIWFFSRSHEFVTTPFSFLSDPQNVLHVFLALMFATPEQLGFDPTMSCFLDDRAHIQYKILVNGTTYVTKKILSDNRAETSRGRVTRVWEAFREDDADRISVVVKDVWVPIDAVTEGAQLLDLHSRLEALVDPGTPRPPRDYFLTVLAHGFVKTSSGSDDNTLDFLHGCVLPPELVECTSRKHYRIVFKEVGEAVEALHSLPELLRALADATQALRLLHRLGLVHRDVSAGNILLVDGMGRLSDLEYLKSFYPAPSPNSSDRRVGTPEYTSPEVASDSYDYLSWTSDPEAEELTQPPPFWFNPLHDLESMMWIVLFAISYHRRRTSTGMRTVLDTYFPAHFCEQTVAARMLVIRSRVLPIPRSDPLFQVARTLDGVRAQLFTHYAEYGKEFQNQYFALDAGKRSPFGELHSTIFDLYEKAIKEAQDVLLVIPDAEKRKASQDIPVRPNNSDNAMFAPRPSKKSRSMSPKMQAPSTRSSGARKRRSPNAAPTRRSLRLAEKRKITKETARSWTEHSSD